VKIRVLWDCEPVVWGVHFISRLLFFAVPIKEAITHLQESLWILLDDRLEWGIWLEAFNAVLTLQMPLIFYGSRSSTPVTKIYLSVTKTLN
jgi:hypothetical protein